MTRSEQLGSKLDLIRKQEEVTFGDRISADRSVAFAVDLIQCADLAAYFAEMTTSFFASSYWSFRALQCRALARTYAEAAYEALQPHTGTVAICNVEASVQGTVGLLAMVQMILIRFSTGTWIGNTNRSRVAWCIKTAEMLGANCDVPVYIGGMLACGKAHIHWETMPSHFKVPIDFEREDDAQSARSTAEAIFGKIVAVLGGTLAAPPNSVEPSQRNLAIYAAMIASEVARLREKFGDPVGYWERSANSLLRAV